MIAPASIEATGAPLDETEQTDTPLFDSLNAADTASPESPPVTED